MGLIHRFTGKWGERFGWSGARVRQYGLGASEGVTETWLIGKAEEAQNFALRYYEIDPGGHSRQETHAHDHGIVFVSGQGRVLLGEASHDVAQGDVVYIRPYTLHQIINTGPAMLGFLCIIPARREKAGEIVWAEEGLAGLEEQP
jgi:quercetin dioxygenase-like cupin family protein